MLGIGSLVSAGVGAASSIYGGIKASQAMKNVKNGIKAQQKANQDWYDRRYNEDGTQRADAQRILQMTADAIKARNRQSAGVNAVMGGNNEAAAATRAANAQAMSDAASQIAVANAARKDNIEEQYMTRNDQYNNALNDLEMKRAENIAKTAQGVTSAMGSIYSMDDPIKKKEQ